MSRILIVDDEASIRETLKEILTYAGGSATIKFTGGNSLQKTGKRTHKIHHKGFIQKTNKIFI